MDSALQLRSRSSEVVSWLMAQRETVFDSTGNLLAELPGWAFASHYIGASNLKQTTDVVPYARRACAG